MKKDISENQIVQEKVKTKKYKNKKFINGDKCIKIYEWFKTTKTYLAIPLVCLHLFGFCRGVKYEVENQNFNKINVENRLEYYGGSNSMLNKDIYNIFTLKSNFLYVLNILKMDY